MKNLTLNLEEEICIIDKYGLTPNELLVIRVLLILQDDRQEELFHNLLIALKHTDLSFRDILVQLQNKKLQSQLHFELAKKLCSLKKGISGKMY